MPTFSNYNVIHHSIGRLYTNTIKSHTGSLYKQDGYIYSYGQIIADVSHPTNNIIYGKTAKYNNYYSQTTSTHVNKVISYCMDNEKQYTLFTPNYKQKQNIKNFNILKITYDTPKECPITLLNYTEGYKTICNHEFSTKALIKWLDLNYNCPLCRTNLI
tara:strand:+ start:127 stop:603 length:477 start_codon:yes stop_codon:yes gene_type:complete